jgi:hypothetical protein
VPHWGHSQDHKNDRQAHEPYRIVLKLRGGRLGLFASMPQLLSEASDQLRGSLEAEVAIVMAGNPLKAAEAPLIGEGLVGGERSGRGLSHRSGIFSVDLR